MDASYRRPVFDEWAILSLAAQQGILAYSGPRAESFRSSFPEDVEPLRTMIVGRAFAIGDFEFATDAGGTATMQSSKWVVPVISFVITRRRKCPRFAVIPNG